MSLITQCPACSTLFKVVPDQLRVSDGWVRCGQCDEVFDANLHLQSAQASAVAPQARPNATVETAVETTAQDAFEPSPQVENTLAVEVEESVVDPFFEKSPQELARDTELPVGMPDDVVHPTFMRPDRAVERSGNVWIRASMVGLSMLLVVSLIIQVVLQERDRLAATEPHLASFLSAMCSVFRCKVSPLRQIDSLSIDSSSFAKVRADVYRLNFVLKNSAPVDLAVPAVEMTLSDLQDQTLIRRVVESRDMGLTSVKIPAGGELNISVPIQVKLEEKSQRISGYRLLVFYP